MAPPKFLRMRRYDDDDDEGGENECLGCMKSFLSHLALFLVVILYCVGGAYLFIAVELPQEELRREAKRRVGLDVHDALTYLVDYMFYFSSQNATMSEFKNKAMSKVIVFHDFVVSRASDGDVNYDGDVNSWDYSWTFAKSLLFTVTSIASIGYGHIAPKTFFGKIICILYNVVGIPLMLVFLANIGNLMATFFTYTYSRVCCRWCRFRRRMAEMKKGKTVESKVLWKDDVGEESYMPTGEVYVPIVINMSLIALYLILGGVLFSVWEGWELHSSAYFTFITLSTIGFGDYVPGNSFMGEDKGVTQAFKMIVTILFSLFGMALVSMCISLMQEQLVLKVRWAAKELGLQKEEIDPKIKYKIKEKQANVIVTPPDKDGNKKLELTNFEDKYRNK